MNSRARRVALVVSGVVLIVAIASPLSIVLYWVLHISNIFACSVYIHERVFVVAAIWLTLGLAWAPCGGMILAMKSSARLPMRFRSRFRLGARSSLLFLSPWMYLFCTSYWVQPQGWVLKAMYISIYGVWLLGAMLNTITFSLLGLAIPLSFIFDPWGVLTEAYPMAVYLLLLPLQTWMLIKSYRGLRRQWAKDVREAQMNGDARPLVDLRRPMYLRPFSWAYVSTVSVGLYHWCLNRDEFLSDRWFVRWG